MKRENFYFLIGVVGIIVIFAVLFLGLQGKEEKGPTPTPTGPSKNVTGRRFAVTGYSTKSNAQAAVEEATEMINQKIGKEKINLVVAFANANYNEEKVLKNIQEGLNTTKIYGGTSSAAVLSTGGYHPQGLALMGITDPKTSFAVGSSKINKETRGKEAGKKAIKEALKNAGKQNPDLILITPVALGQEEEILRGIESVVGNDTPIFGGAAADNAIKGNWKGFAKGKAIEKGTVIAAVWTDRKLGYAYRHGFRKSKEKGVITEAKGRVIYEINGKPAAEVYQNWTETDFSEELQEGGKILLKSNVDPIAKKYTTKGGKVSFVSVHPLAINATDYSLTVFADVKKGDKIQHITGTWQLVLNRGRNTPKEALRSGDISKENALYGIYTFCGGTLLAIPKGERARMPSLIKKSIGSETPFIGTFTFGEQGYVPAAGRNVHGNLVNSMVVFGKK